MTSISGVGLVTVSGTGSGGDVVAIDDGSTLVTSLTLTASGSRSTTLLLGIGTHAPSATRTAAGVASARGATVTTVVR